MLSSRYEKNLQGDIVAVYDNAGTKLMSYEYDAFGNSIPQMHVYREPAYNNPFRYRGYYYDQDLELYYLNSRYYDSFTGRFINADDSLYHSILGYNMFAYCNNNPVNFADYSGESAGAITSAFGWLWTAAFVEPTPVGEIVAGAITVAGAIGLVVAIGSGVVQVGEWIDSASQATKKEDVLVAPPQSVTDHSNEEKAYHADNKSEKPPVYKDVPPTEREGFYHKGNKPTMGKTKDGKRKGWVDKNGNIWVPAPTGSGDDHGGGHWDVQRPDGKGYVNVYPGGKMRTGNGKIPVFKR